MSTEDLTYIPGVKDLLDEKVKALKEFLSVTNSLYDSLTARDMVQLGRGLEQRQNLIHSIDEIDMKIVEAWPSNSDSAKGPWGFLFKRMKELLHEIADLDKKCLSQGQFLRDEFQKEIFAMRQGWKAARQYSQPASFQPRFMDLRQ